MLATGYLWQGGKGAVVAAKQLHHRKQTYVQETGDGKSNSNGVLAKRQVQGSTDSRSQEEHAV